jgi:hypothetical protein
MKLFMGLYRISQVPRFEYNEFSHLIKIIPGIADDRHLYPYLGK